LNRVDLPTLGRPTMPHFRLMALSFCAAGREPAEGRNPSF
jgi:hypothetical protein